MNKTFYIVITALLFFLITRLVSGKLFIEDTLYILPVYLLLIFWLVVPFISGGKMMTSLEHTLERGEDDLLRSIMFTAGIISLLVLSFSPFDN